MQNKFSKVTVGFLSGMTLATVAAAHPGHEVTDVAATVGQPLAGPEHLLAFLALSGALLGLLAVLAKARDARTRGSRR